MSRTSLFRRVAGSLALSTAAAVLTPTVARADLTFTLGGVRGTQVLYIAVQN